MLAGATCACIINSWTFVTGRIRGNGNSRVTRAEKGFIHRWTWVLGPSRLIPSSILKLREGKGATRKGKKKRNEKKPAAVVVR